ncbi:MAG: hypothetical protein MJY66_06230 [Bacteroidaceae bacterium]|nr:hypothetical protein [Bacteroidaceae bacterium]
MKNKAIVLLLALVMPLNAIQASYIKEVAVSGNSDKNTAINNLKNEGFTVLGTDLNDKAGGWYIYLGYKTTDKFEEAITNLMVMRGSTFSSSYGQDKVVNVKDEGKNWEYHPVRRFSFDYDGDLNRKAGGDDLFLYYTHSNISDGYAIGSLAVQSSGSSKSNPNYVKAYNSGGSIWKDIDVNRNAGGRYVYILKTMDSYNATSSMLDSDFRAVHLGGRLYQFIIPVGIAQDGKPALTLATGSSGMTFIKAAVDGDGEYTCFTLRNLNTEGLSFKDEWTMSLVPSWGSVINEEGFEESTATRTVTCSMGNHKDRKLLSVLWLAPSTWNPAAISSFGLSCSNAESGSVRFNVLKSKSPEAPSLLASGANSITVMDPFLDYDADRPGWLTSFVNSVQNFHSLGIWDGKENKFVIREYFPQGQQNRQFSIPSYNSEHELVALLHTDYVTTMSDGTMDTACAMLNVPFNMLALHRISRQDSWLDSNTDTLGIPHPVPVIEWGIESPNDEDLLSSDQFILYRSNTEDFADISVVTSFGVTDTTCTETVADTLYGWFSYRDELDGSAYRSAANTGRTMYLLPETQSSILPADFRKRLMEYVIPERKLYYYVSRATIDGMWPGNAADYCASYEVPLAAALPAVTYVGVKKMDNWDDTHKVEVTVKLDNPYFLDLASESSESSVRSLMPSLAERRMYVWDSSAGIVVERYSPVEDHWKENGPEVDYAAKTITIPGKDVKWNDAEGCYMASFTDYQTSPYTSFYYRAKVDTAESVLPTCIGRNTFVCNADSDAFRINGLAFISASQASAGIYPGLVYVEWEVSEGMNDSFSLFRRKAGDSEWKQLALDNPMATSYSDSDVLPGTVYEYRIVTEARFKGETYRDSVSIFGTPSYYGNISGRIRLEDGSGMPARLAVNVERLPYTKDGKSTSSFSIPDMYCVSSTADSILLKEGYSDDGFNRTVNVNADGTFFLDSIPYAGEGMKYRLQVLGTSCSLENPAGSNGAYDVLLDAENYQVSNVNFTCKDTYRISGYVMYDGSTVPSRYVNFRVNGVLVTDANGNPVETDQKGAFSFAVPRANVTVQACRAGHQFKGGGYVLGGTNADEVQFTPTHDYDGVRIWDLTTVRLVGRLAGGNTQGNLPQGLGFGTNNLGDDLTMVLQLEGDESSQIVFNPNDPDNVQRDTVFYQTITHNGQTENVDSTAVSFQKKRIVVYPDVRTGEFCLDLYPAKYKVVQMSAKGYSTLFSRNEGFEVLDITNDTVVMAVSDTLTLERREMDVRSGWYQACYRKIYHNEPTITYVQTDAAGMAKGWLGEEKVTEASLTGNDMTAPVAWVDRTTGRTHYLFGYPVFMQGSRYVFRVTAHEDYYYNGDRSRQPDAVYLDGGSLTVYNGLESSTSKLSAELDRNGSALVVLGVDNPTFTGKGEQALRQVNMEVCVNDMYYRADPLKAYVLGMKQEGSDFATMGERINVLDIVRDPYGTQSYAYRDAGTRYNWTHSNTKTTSCSFSLNVNIGGGNTNYVGVGMAVKNEWSLVFNGGINIPMTCDITSQNGEYNMTLNERISTSSAAFDEGANSDVYIGVVECMTLGKAKAFCVIDSFSYNSLKPAIDNGTVVLVGQGVDSGGTPYYLVIGDKLTVGDSVKSTFAYSQRFILGTLIPNMEDELDLMVLDCTEAEARDLAVKTGQPKYYLDSNGDIEMAVPDTTGVYVNSALEIYRSIVAWKEQIGINERKKLDMINHGQVFKRYSVSNTSVSYSEDASTFYTKIESSKTASDDNFNGSISGNIGGGYNSRNNDSTSVAKKANDVKTNVSKVSIPGFILNVSGGFNPSTNWSNSASYRRTASAGAGFVLSMTDNSYMDMDVYRYVDREVLGTTQWEFITNADADSKDYRDDVSEGEFIFVMRGGARRNPWLAPDSTLICIDQSTGRGYPLGEQLLKIDNPRIYIDRPAVSNVPMGERAVFSVRLANESEISSDAKYLLPSTFKLKLYDQSNPNGAKIYMDGMPVTDGRTFVIAPGTSLTKTFEVERGTGYDFDDIRLNLMDMNGSLKSSATFSVHYLPESTPVTLVQPADGWVLNTLSAVDSIGYYLPVEISGYDINFDSFDHIELQYKKSTDGESQWTNLCSYYANDSLYQAASGEKERIVSGSIRNIRFYGAADPVEISYDLRAVSFCRLGTGYVSRASEVASGLKDTRCPQVFGKPKPAGGILSYDEVISLPFNEKVAYNNLSAVSNFQIQGYTNNSDIDHKVSVRFQDADTLDTDFIYPDASFAKSSIERSLTDRDFSIDMMARIENRSKDAFLYLQEKTLNDENDAFYFGYSPMNDYLFAFFDNSTVTSEKLSTLGLRVDEVMTHLGMTYSATDGLVSFFVGDRMLSATVSETGNPNPVCHSSGKVVLGYGLIGNMTDVRLWGKTLDAYEIANKYGKRLPDNETGMIAYWPMDEGSGSIVTDKVAGADLTFSKCSWETPAGYSLRIEGKPVRLNRIERFQRDAAADYSLSFWFRTEKLESDSVALFRAGADALGETGNGKLWIGFKNGSFVCRSNGKDHIAADGDYADGLWHRFSFVVDHSHNVASVYLDQNLKAEVKAGQVDGVANDRILLGDSTFYGNIDELSFWHLALPYAYLQELYNTALLGTEMELLVYMPFEMDLQNDQATMYTGFSPYNMKKTVSGTFDLSAPMLDESAVTADASQHAPIRSNTGLENFQFDWLCTENELQIDIRKADSEINHQQVFITVRGVEDNAGNTMQQPQMWSVYVDRNVLEWKGQSRNVNVTYGNDTTLTIDWQNTSGRSVSYTIYENCNWLTLSQTMGSVSPMEEKQVEVGISDILSPGNYSTTLYLTDDNGLSNPMTINLTVEARQPVWVPTSDQRYSQSMLLVGQVYTRDSDGNEYIDTDKRDLVGVFSDGVCVGVANIAVQGSTGKGEDSNIYLNILGTTEMNPYGDYPGQPLEFRLWDATRGTVSILLPDTIRFSNNKALGVVPDDPVQFHVSEYKVQEISLKEGWNWVSFNVMPLQDHGLGSLFMDNGAFSSGDIIQHVGNPAFGIYDDNDKWLGRTESIDISYTNVYLIYMHAPGIVKVKGRAIRAIDRIVRIDHPNRWNELPYLLEVAQPINVALSDYPLPYQSARSKATEGDWVKSHDEFAVATATGWVGSLKTMRPGVGYYLFHQGDSCKILYTNNSNNFGTNTEDDETDATVSDNAVRTRAGASPKAMPAILELADKSLYQDGDMIVAYADGEEAGHAGCTTLADGGKHYFLMINASDGAHVQFALVRDGEIRAITKAAVSFDGEGMLGTVGRPYPVDFSEPDGNDDVYDLMGRRYGSSTPVQGVHIRGNRKVLDE